MAFDPAQQLEKTLLNCREALVILPQNPSSDLIGAGRAFYYFLEKKKITPTLVYEDKTGTKNKLFFLPRPDKEKDFLSGSRDFILSFSTRYNKITGCRTEEKEDEFRIYITPEKGSIDPRDFSFIPAKFRYDLIIALGCVDKESAGKIYEENPDIFFEVPIVNIDNQVANENFGQINIVTLTASSVSEIVADILEKINAFSMDEKIAQCLLVGLISATDSFQNKKTTPHCLQVAAKLMENGADQQSIVRHLYKTESFNILKLWGRVMSRLKFDKNLKLVWSPVYLEDFVQSRTQPQDLFLILEKIRENFKEALFFLLFYNESVETMTAVIRCADPESALEVNGFLGGRREGNTVIFKASGGDKPEEAEREILEKVRQVLNARINKTGF